jgi:hypothetical protein
MKTGKAKTKETEKQPGPTPPAETAAIDRPAQTALARPASRGPVEGFENMGAEDVTQPRLMLTQNGTPQRKEENDNYIEGLKEGDFFNSVTGEIYGKKVRITPVMFFKQNLLFQDIDEGGGLLCRAVDARHGVGTPGGDCATCPKMQWIDNEPPECMLYHNYAALVIPDKGAPNLDALVIVSMKSTNIKMAKDWNSLMRMRQDENHNQLPMWRGIYELESQFRQEGKYSWYVAVPKNAGMHKAGLNAAYNSCHDAYLAVREMYAAGKLMFEAETLAADAESFDRSM